MANGPLHKLCHSCHWSQIWPHPVGLIVSIDLLFRKTFKLPHWLFVLMQVKLPDQVNVTGLLVLNGCTKNHEVLFALPFSVVFFFLC